MKKSEMHLLAQALLCYFSDFLTKASNTARILYIENLPQNFTFCGKSYLYSCIYLSDAYFAVPVR